MYSQHYLRQVVIMVWRIFPLLLLLRHNHHQHHRMLLALDHQLVLSRWPGNPDSMVLNSIVCVMSDFHGKHLFDSFDTLRFKSVSVSFPSSFSPCRVVVAALSCFSFRRLSDKGRQFSNLFLFKYNLKPRFSFHIFINTPKHCIACITSESSIVTHKVEEMWPVLRVHISFFFLLFSYFFLVFSSYFSFYFMFFLEQSRCRCCCCFRWNIVLHLR